MIVFSMVAETVADQSFQDYNLLLCCLNIVIWYKQVKTRNFE